MNSANFSVIRIARRMGQSLTGVSVFFPKTTQKLCSADSFKQNQ